MYPVISDLVDCGDSAIVCTLHPTEYGVCFACRLPLAATRRLTGASCLVFFTHSTEHVKTNGAFLALPFWYAVIDGVLFSDFGPTRTHELLDFFFIVLLFVVLFFFRCITLYPRNQTESTTLGFCMLIFLFLFIF